MQSPVNQILSQSREWHADGDEFEIPGHHIPLPGDVHRGGIGDFRSEIIVGDWLLAGNGLRRSGIRITLSIQRGAPFASVQALHGLSRLSARMS
jgi:hypothetical protein